MYGEKKSLKISKGYPEVVNIRRTNNTMATKNRTKKTSNDRQNPTQITKDCATQTH